MNPISIQITFADKTRLFSLADALITIGSDPKCTLVLPFPWIAPHHLEIEHGLLLSRVRCPSQNAPATLDGYPITRDWSILPKHAAIEIPSPMGAKLTIATDLQPIPIAASTPAVQPPPPAPQIPFSAPMDVSLRVARASQSDGVLMKYIPLGVAAVLLLGIVAVIFVINNQNPPPPPMAIAPPAPPPSTSPATIDETPTPAPATSTKPAAAPSSPPIAATVPIVAIAPALQPATLPLPTTRASGRRHIATAPTTGPSEYALLDDETRDLLSHLTAAPLKSDLLRSAAYEQARLAISARLKNSANLQFPNVDSGEVLIDFHDGVYIVRGHFSSMNSTGVPLRQLFFCKLRPAEHHWEIIQTEIFAG